MKNLTFAGTTIRSETHKLYRLATKIYVVGMVFDHRDICVQCAPLLSKKVLGHSLQYVQERCKAQNYKLELVGTFDSI